MQLHVSVALATLLAGLALAPVAARGDCARTEIGPEPITRPGAKIPADGGILVGVGRATEHRPAQGDPSQAAGYKAAAHGKPVALVMASLAPGLTVYRPKAPVVGAVDITAGKAPVLSVTFDKAKGAALPAPGATAVALVSSPGYRGTTSTQVVVSVDAVPDAAARLVLYEMKDEEHVPISAGEPAHDKQGATSVVVYTSGSHCSGPRLAAEHAPTAGDEVTLAWVDAFGRLSPISAPVTVK